MQMNSNFYIVIHLPGLSLKLIKRICLVLSIVKKWHSKLIFFFIEGGDNKYRHNNKTVSIHCLKKKKVY